MDTATIIQSIAGVIKVASAVVQTAEDAKPFAKAIYDTVAGKDDITAGDLRTLQDRVDELSGELMAPLPPDQP